MSRLPDATIWRDRRVALTGHTGFKGSWLAQWLVAMGARVFGLSDFDPRAEATVPHVPLPSRLAEDLRADVADVAVVREWLRAVRPTVVVHLAAQPLVGVGYRMPWRTLASNVLGTAAVIEAAMSVPSVVAVLLVTSDKVYDPSGGRPLSEEDGLGLGDPYSASKALAERVADLYGGLIADRPESPGSPRLATARAGNVLGGGDWSEGRIVPDFFRAAGSGSDLVLRAPDAVRPWQHVLDPLCGYILLCEDMLAGHVQGRSAFNFGPDDNGRASVERLVSGLMEHWGGVVKVSSVPRPEMKETGQLRLDSSKARAVLGWEPRWGFEEMLRRTAHWYREALSGQDTSALTLGQLREYCADVG